MAKKAPQRGRPNGGGISITTRIPEVARLRGQNKSAAQITRATGINAASLNQRVIPALNVLRQVTKILALHHQAEFTDAQISASMDVDEAFVNLVINDYQDNIDKWIA